MLYFAPRFSSSISVWNVSVLSKTTGYGTLDDPAFTCAFIPIVTENGIYLFISSNRENSSIDLKPDKGFIEIIVES